MAGELSRDAYLERLRALYGDRQYDLTITASGGCPDSPDEYAERIWLGTGGTVAIHPVRPDDVKKHGSFGKAAFMRNIDIVDDCDRLVAFWNGVSKGAKHSIDLALKAHKNVEVIFP